MILGKLDVYMEKNYVGLLILWASLVAETLKNPPAMQETQLWSLGRKDPLEKEMAPHSSILAWKIPWMGDPGRLLHDSPWGHKELDTTEWLHFLSLPNIILCKKLTQNGS